LFDITTQGCIFLNSDCACDDKMACILLPLPEINIAILSMRIY
jgi:hypothetical protein